VIYCQAVKKMPINERIIEAHTHGEHFVQCLSCGLLGSEGAFPFSVLRQNTFWGQVCTPDPLMSVPVRHATPVQVCTLKKKISTVEAFPWKER